MHYSETVGKKAMSGSFTEYLHPMSGHRKRTTRRLGLPVGVLVCLWGGLGALSMSAHSVELGGEEVDFEFAVQGRYYPQEAAQEQAEASGGVRSQVEYYTSFNDDQDLLQFTAWYLWDSEDDDRTHGDIQELAWLHIGDSWELRSGVRKVFWGVTESQHLVDVVNQTDLAVNPDGEEKLGQPMINLSVVTDFGIWDVLVLLGHRERLYPGTLGRFRPILTVSSEAEYESGDEEKRVDFAARWQKSLGNLEFAISHFSGTSREPTFNGINDDDELIPFYAVMDQTGLEAQYILDAWILKLEAISSTSEGLRYTAATAGFEYTQVGIFNSAMDFGWISEFNFDDRGTEGPSVSEHDLMLGGRLSFNDAASSQIVGGLNYDIETEEKMFFLEASKRITDSLKINIDALVVAHSDEPPTVEDFKQHLVISDKKLSSVSRDDFIQVELVYYF